MYDDDDNERPLFRVFHLHQYLYVERRISRFHCDEKDIVLVGTFVPGEYRRQSDDPRILPEYKEWRSQVFKRDDYTCQECGSTESLESHHIKQVTLFPELMFDVDNGITLCKECHGDVPILRRNRS
jgi:predicted restriction endonuclease